MDNHIVSIFDFGTRNWPMMGISYFSTLMISSFSRISNHIRKALTSIFTWSGHLLILLDLLAQRTLPWMYGSNVFPLFFFFVFITTIFSHFMIFSCGLWQTLLNQITFCVRDIGKSSLHLKSFLFCSLSKEFLQKKVTVLEMKTFITIR